jgi:hypothetical protein
MSDVMDADREKAHGVWVAYGQDHSYHLSTTVFEDELSALRYALANYLSVGFLRFGDSLDKATATTEEIE